VSARSRTAVVSALKNRGCPCCRGSCWGRGGPSERWGPRPLRRLHAALQPPPARRQVQCAPRSSGCRGPSKASSLPRPKPSIPSCCGLPRRCAPSPDPAWGFYTRLVCSIALGPARGAGSSALFFIGSGKTATTSFFACAPGLRRVYSHVTLVATRLTLTAPPLQKGREERSAQSVVRCRDPCAPSVPSTIVELR